MGRTNTGAVQGLLGINYDSKRAPDLQQFIDAASSLVDQAVAMALAKGVRQSVAELELVERWLSCHCYQQYDQGYRSRSTLQGNGQFQGSTGLGFDSTFYGQTAMRLDSSGCLRAINSGRKLSLFWPGKVASEQTSYEDRNGSGSGAGDG